MPGIPMLGSFCSSFHLTPPSDWSAEESSLALARSCRDEDLLTRLENLPFPVDLPFLLSVEDAGSTEDSFNINNQNKVCLKKTAKRVTSCKRGGGFESESFF